MINRFLVVVAVITSSFLVACTYDTADEGAEEVEYSNVSVEATAVEATAVEATAVEGSNDPSPEMCMICICDDGVCYCMPC